MISINMSGSISLPQQPPNLSMIDIIHNAFGWIGVAVYFRAKSCIDNFINLDSMENL